MDNVGKGPLLVFSVFSVLVWQSSHSATGRWINKTEQNIPYCCIKNYPQLNPNHIEFLSLDVLGGQAVLLSGLVGVAGQLGWEVGLSLWILSSQILLCLHSQWAQGIKRGSRNCKAL